MSRAVIARLFSSVNGVAESPKLFQFGAFGPEEGGRTLGGVILTYSLLR